MSNYRKKINKIDYKKKIIEDIFLRKFKLSKSGKFLFFKQQFLIFINSFKTLFVSIVEELKNILDIILSYDIDKNISSDKKNLEYYEYIIEIIDNNINFFIDDNKFLFQIKSAAGGLESGLFVNELMEFYIGFLNFLNFEFDVVSTSFFENSYKKKALREVSLLINNRNFLNLFFFLIGVHKVQRVPITEKSNRKHTSNVTFYIFPFVDSDFEFNSQDLLIESCRSTGAGGQHVNKTNSAVSILHKPTKIRVKIQSERSYHQNLIIAKRLLKLKIENFYNDKQHNLIDKIKKSQTSNMKRNEAIINYNFYRHSIIDLRFKFNKKFNFNSFINRDYEKVYDFFKLNSLLMKLFFVYFYEI